MKQGTGWCFCTYIPTNDMFNLSVTDNGSALISYLGCSGNFRSRVPTFREVYARSLGDMAFYLWA